MTPESVNINNQKNIIPQVMNKQQEKNKLSMAIWKQTKNEICMEYPFLIWAYANPCISGRQKPKSEVNESESEANESESEANESEAEVNESESEANLPEVKASVPETGTILPETKATITSYTTIAIEDKMECLLYDFMNGKKKKQEEWIADYAENPRKVKDDLLLEVLFCILRNQELFDEKIIEQVLEAFQRKTFPEAIRQKLKDEFGEKEFGQKQKRGSRSADEKEELLRIQAKRSNYRDFLWKFMTTKEELELDADSFDYIYYTIGMEQYDNMPLLEELEYREVNRLDQLVIAIDTSGSCKKETVQRFLEETFSILNEKENFFHKMLVYIIQCDCSVQDVMVIRSEQDWKECQKRIVIQGRGGTDFGPVFRYVEQEQKENRLNNLKALIYFTDGDGVYPDQKTPYETAFAFLEENEHMKKVPSWCHILNNHFHLRWGDTPFSNA